MIRISIAEEGNPPRLLTFQTSEVTLGRSEQCDLTLGGRGVSGRHCRLIETPQGVHIEDLGSTNGTYVNRHRLTTLQRVTERDEIVMAVYQIRVLDGAAAQARPPSMVVQGAGHASAGYPPAGAAGGGTSMPPGAGAGPASAGGSMPPHAPVVSSMAPSGAPSRPPGSSPSSPVARPPGTHAASAPSAVPPSASFPGRAGSDSRSPSSQASVPPRAHGTSGSTSAPDQADVVWAREREKIDSLSRAWANAGKDGSFLLRGAKLSHARTWLAQGKGRHPGPKREHVEFIAASTRAHQARLVRNVLSIGAVLGGIGGVALWWFQRTPEVEEAPDTEDPQAEVPDSKEQEPAPDNAARLAASQQAAAKAMSLLESDPALATRVALEAVARLPGSASRGSEAERALRAALSDLRGLVLAGHEGEVAAVAMTPEGGFAVTGSGRRGSGTGRIWDLGVFGRPTVFPLRGHGAPVREVEVTSDGKYLFTAGDDFFLYRTELQARDPVNTSLKMTGHSTSITAIDVSADGRWLISGDSGGTARIWDATASSARAQTMRDHDAPIRDVAINRDGTRSVTVSEDGTGSLRHLEAGQPGRRIRLDGHEGPVRAAVFAPDGSWVLTGGDDETVRMWDPSSSFPGLRKPVLEGHEHPITHVAISKDSRLGISADTSGQIRIWELRAKEPGFNATVFGLHEGELTSMSTVGPPRVADERLESDHHSVLVTSGRDGKVLVLNLDRKDHEQDAVTLAGHEGAVLDAGATADGTVVISGGEDGTARVWDVSSSKALGASLVARGHAREVLDVAVTRATHRMVTGSADGTARIWDITNPARIQPLAVLDEHAGRVKAVAISPNEGKFLATAGEDRVIRLWNLLSEDPSNAHLSLNEHKGEVNDLLFSPDGSVLVSIGADRSAIVWNMRTADVAKSARVLRHRDEVNAVAIDDSGRRLLTGSISEVRLWDLSKPDGAPLGLQGHEVDIVTVAMRPDAKWAATSSKDPLLILWDLSGESPRPIKLRRHSEQVDALAFSPDGRWLVSGSRDKTIRLWDLESEHPDQGSVELTGLDSFVTELEFTKDGRWLVSGTAGSDIVLWDLQAGDGEAISKSAMRLPGHSGFVSALEVSRNGRFIVSASYDGTARLWPLEVQDLVAMACRRLGRGLDRAEWQQTLGAGEPRDLCR